MTFSIALEALKQGFTIQRSNWNAPNQIVYLAAPKSSHFITLFPKQVPEDACLRKITSDNPYLVLLTASGNYQPGWVPSVSDLFAEDWVVL